MKHFPNCVIFLPSENSYHPNDQTINNTHLLQQNSHLSDKSQR